MLTKSSDTFFSHYQELISTGAIEADPAQAVVADIADIQRPEIVGERLARQRMAQRAIHQG